MMTISISTEGILTQCIPDHKQSIKIWGITGTNLRGNKILQISQFFVLFAKVSVAKYPKS